MKGKHEKVKLLRVIISQGIYILVNKSPQRRNQEKRQQVQAPRRHPLHHQAVAAIHQTKAAILQNPRVKVATQIQAILNKYSDQ